MNNDAQGYSHGVNYENGGDLNDSAIDHYAQNRKSLNKRLPNPSNTHSLL